MKINVELNSESLTAGLRFYGETYADKRVVEKINELEDILDDVVWSLRNLNYQVTGRQEASAKDIKDKIDQMGIYLGINLNFEEEEEK